MSRPPQRNPFREDVTVPGMLGIRITRWAFVLAVAGVLVFGVVSFRDDLHDVDDLLLSDTARVEVAVLSRIDDTGPGKSRKVTTTAVVGGQEYEQTGLHAWADREGEPVRIITHPETDLWIMTTMDGEISTEGRVRNSAQVFIYPTAALLATFVGIVVHNRRMAPRWEVEQARIEEIARAHPGVRSRAEQRRLGILPGGDDQPG